MDFVLMFMVLVVYLALGAIMLTLSLSSETKNKKGETRVQGTNFIPSQMFMSTDGHGGIAVNEQIFKICLFHTPTAPPRLLPISSLVGSFLVKNGEVLKETLRTFPKSLMSFQELMHPNAERLIKSWKNSPSQKDNQRIDLMVWIHDEDEPFHVVNFLNMETKEGGILFEKSLDTATHWHKVLSGMILQADQLVRFQRESNQDDTEQPTKDSALTSAAS